MIVNLTPHDVHVCNDNNELACVIKTKGYIVRCTTSKPPEQQYTLTIDRDIKVPVVEATVFDGIEAVNSKGGKADYDFNTLLKQQPNDIFIVSGIVAEYIHKTMPQKDPNFIVPDTDPSSVVRDWKGVIVGVKRFYSYAQRSVK
jgi:hypothetical protein